jgi:hypothetical protein
VLCHQYSRTCNPIVYQDSGYIATQVHLLQEMFPGACSIEVQHCLTIAEGDVARAAQLVLHRQEAGQSLSSNATVLQVSSSYMGLADTSPYSLLVCDTGSIFLKSNGNDLPDCMVSCPSTQS